MLKFVADVLVMMFVLIVVGIFVRGFLVLITGSYLDFYATIVTPRFLVLHFIDWRARMMELGDPFWPWE